MQTEISVNSRKASTKASVTEKNTHRQSREINSPAVELKGSVFTLPILQIQSTSISDIEIALQSHIAKARKFFENAPFVIDLKSISQNSAEEQNFDFHGLMKLLSQQHLIPVGVRNGSSQQNALAISAGLAILKGGLSAPEVEEKPVSKERPTPEAENSSTPVSTSPHKTKVITQPVRSGQQVYAKGGDLIIMAPVNHGAEVIADGNIHIYSTMRGRALAGVLGDVNASIFCQSMEAELVAIAGNFRVFEEDMPAAIKSKSVRVHLNDEQLMITEL